MHSNVTIKNVSWLHFSWATLYFPVREFYKNVYRRKIRDVDNLKCILLRCFYSPTAVMRQ